MSNKSLKPDSSFEAMFKQLLRGTKSFSWPSIKSNATSPAPQMAEGMNIDIMGGGPVGGGVKIQRVSKKGKNYLGFLPQRVSAFFGGPTPNRKGQPYNREGAKAYRRARASYWGVDRGGWHPLAAVKNFISTNLGPGYHTSYVFRSGLTGREVQGTKINWKKVLGDLVSLKGAGMSSGFAYTRKGSMAKPYHDDKAWKGAVTRKRKSGSGAPPRKRMKLERR